MSSQRSTAHPRHNSLINQAGKKRRNSDEVPTFLNNYIPLLQESHDRGQTSRLRELDLHYWRHLSTQALGTIKAWNPRRILGIPLVLIIIWTIFLWWNEEATFKHRIEECTWDRWENWSSAANPHHVLLVADPQLVDPHTYPGRPWPLSALTIYYTDLYMRKSFQYIQNILMPDSVFFLGDLFDGGREWSTDTGSEHERESPDERWRKYGTNFWLQEYQRFSRIFFDTWLHGDSKTRRAQPGRKFIAGLPGNHDLGLGNGVRIPVRKRFQAYFGNGNRIDVVGNHSFISIDTVSLSAKGQNDPVSGTAGISDIGHNKEVWDPVDQFLHNAKAEKGRAIARELRVRYGEVENEMLDNTARELEDAATHKIFLQSQKDTEVPSVILTHVPLYRPPGTACGPLRERFPPSKTKQANGDEREKDDANSIRVEQGVQYQNVLTPDVSNEIIDLVGDVSHVFSGDDHDYCDIIHRGYTSKTGGIREVTVKSISWAMGIRKPGFVLLSLWNPVDAEGKIVGPVSPKSETLQSHLCLLPDQLLLFVQYVWLLIFTLLVLFVRALKTAYVSSPTLQQGNGYAHSLSNLESSKRDFEDVTSVSTRSQPSQNGLAVRSSTGRPRSVSPSHGYGYKPPLDQKEEPLRHDSLSSKSVDKSRSKSGLNDVLLEEPSTRKHTAEGIVAVYKDFRTSVFQVASFVLIWYVWLLWNS